jgi:C-terminal processing protease CtpA/Prc
MRKDVYSYELRQLFISVDGEVVSAKEDFVQPLKDNHGAVVIGKQTTGHPYFYNFNAGIQITIFHSRPGGDRNA